MTQILKLLGSILLILLALFLFTVITPLALIWKIAKSTTHKKFDFGISHYFIEIAASFDQLGNAAFGGFFNWLCISKKLKKGVKPYNFGDKDETISEVLGWNSYIGALSKFGSHLVILLDALDKNHCGKAMQNGLNKAKQKVKFYNTL